MSVFVSGRQNIFLLSFVFSRVSYKSTVAKVCGFYLCPVPVSQIERVEMQMPNKHYNTLDLSKFTATIKGGSENEEVYQPVDKPAGIIHAQLERSNKEMASRPRQVFRRRAKL